MNSKVRHVLVFILLLAFCQAHAQQSETTEPVQNRTVKDIQYAKEKAGELQDKAFTKIDSLSCKSSNLLRTATDSLNNLSSAIQGKITSKIDSMQQKLNEIKDNPPSLKSYGGRGQLANVTEKTDKLTASIDSLQNLLSNKMAKLNKYVGETNLTDKLQIPARYAQAEYRRDTQFVFTGK